MIKVLKYSEVSNEEIFKRNEPCADVSGVVSEIISNVKNNGDKALFEYAEKFDKAKLKELEVRKDEIKAAVDNADKEFLRILNSAAENIRAFHEKQKRPGFIINEKDGVVIGQKVMPLEKVGVYVPGGTAAYPSTVLMNVIPAKLAGCGEIIMVSPPSCNGKIDPAILTASYVAGVDRVFRIGGAQAVAALAFGTESVPKVDKITGPGNAYVAEAKKQVFGFVSIDMIAGPSEILIVSDGKTNPVYAAADMLSQAEHDKNASAVLITDSVSFAESVKAELEKQIPQLKRASIARASIDNNGKIVIVSDIKEALKVANEIAPEHLELCVEDPFDILSSVKNAGSVFMGRYCPEALGDYFAGPNHTLPTSGTARFSSPLSVDDFVKKIQYTYYTREALGKVADDVAFFAEKEGLTGHAKSVVIRSEEQNERISQ